MIACVWVHVGCLPQIHKQSCQQQDRMVNTKCVKWTLASYMFVLLLMGMRHVPVCDIIAWLYVYACICMIVRVWWFDNVRMMSWWQTQDHIQLVAACHPTWLPLYQVMLVEIPGEVPEGSDVDTCCGSGRFRCRHLVSFWRVSCADTCWGSWPWFFYHCAAPLHACMCMIVSVWLYDNVRMMSSWKSHDY